MAASGEGMMLRAGLDALRALEGPTAPAIRRTLAKTYAGVAPGIRPMCPDARPERTVFLVALPAPWQVHCLKADGDVLAPGMTPYITFPPELEPQDRKRLRRRFENAVDGLPEVEWEAAVRELFEATAALCPSMSPEAQTWTSRQPVEIHCDVGLLTAGIIQNGHTSPDFIMDLGATGSQPLIDSTPFTLLADGNATFGGTVTAESFTGSNPKFEGSVDVRGGEGGDRVSVTATASGGLIDWMNGSGTVKGSIRAESPGFVINGLTGALGGALSLKGSTIRLDANGDLIAVGLPTSDPGVTGALWNDGGTVKIS